MSDNKKYYYMKVKETFFDSEEMKILESQKNGEKYQNLYLKLCLLSLKADGALTFKGQMPYDIQMLSTVLRVDIDTVKTGVEIFQKLSLVDILDSGEIYMTDIQSLIGKSSTEAERIQKYRKSIEDKKKRTNVQQMLQKCTPEIEIEIDKEINKKEYKEKKPTLSAKRKSFVVPTVEEVSAYCKERNNNIDAQYFWDYQSSRGWLIGKAPMKDWKAAIRTFEKNSFNYAKAKNPTNKVRCRDEKDFGNIGGVVDLDGMPEGGIPF